MFEVSVVIPAYNAQEFIAEAIESALTQTVKITEIIVVDDGSSDRTVEIVGSYNDIVRLLQQPNQGSGSARNNGILRSSGNWVAFLDSDDAWEKDHIENLIQVLRHNPDAALAYSGKIWINQNGLAIPSVTVQNEYPSGWIFAKLLENNYISSASCVIARKDILLSCNGFSTGAVFRNSQDYELWLRIAAHHPVMSTSRMSVRYRRHENNQTLKKSNYAMGHLASVRSACILVQQCKINSANQPNRIDPLDRLRRAYREAMTGTFYFRDYNASRLIFREMIKDRILDPNVITRGLICHLPVFIVDGLRKLRRELVQNARVSN
jgi:glycosyltransferase involved in cell wall biosynthesis